MKPDYLTLTDGRRVRVEWNMNSLEQFTAITGIEMTELADGKANIGVLRTIAWCCAIEGEEAEGRTLGMNEKEFGRLIDMAGVIEFSKILTTQIAGITQKKSEPPNKLRQIFYRRKG